VVEPQVARHELALKLGASRVVTNVSVLNGETFNLSLDASGHPAAISSAISVLGQRGRHIQMGVAAPHAKVDLIPYDVYAKEITIIGSASLARQYENAVNRMGELGPKLSLLVTGRFKLEQINEAIDAMRSGQHIKVQLHN
jgi:threonine dehydrogenase-like Zn-dependent dehydrogenase